MANVPTAGTGGIDTTTLQAAANNGVASPISAQHLLQVVFGPIASDPLSALGIGGLTGGGVGNATMGGGDILGTIFSFINLGLLTLGALFLSYKSLSAITQTAHDGEFMGRSFHTVWIPVRVVTGIFSLTPIFSGWSMLQVMMLWIGVLGAGLGNMAWQAVATTYQPYNTTNIAVTSNNSFDPKFVPEVFRMVVCVDAHNAQISNATSGISGSGLGVPPQWGSQQVTNPDGSVTFQFGSNGGAQTECGAVSIPAVSGNVNSNSSGVGNVAIGSDNQSYSNFFGTSAEQLITSTSIAQKQDLQQISVTQFNTLLSTIQSPASDFVKSVNDMLTNPENTTKAPAANYQTLNQIQANYASGLSSAFAGVLNGMNLGGGMSQMMTQSAQNDGFTAAGAWYMTMASMSYAVNSISDSLSPILSANPQPIQSGDTVYAKAMQILDYQEIALGFNSNTIGSSYGSQTGSSTSSGAWQLLMKTAGSQVGILGSLLSAPGQTLINWFVTDNSGLPVVIRVKNMADNMVTLAEGIITVIGAAQGASSSVWAEAIKGATSVASGGASNALIGAFQPWISYTMFTCELAMGFFLMASIFLPLIPFLVYMGQVLSWLLSVIEGVAAAPFLAFAHFDTDGEGLGQRTTFGYTFMLQSFMRPVMLVFGFIVASKMIDVMGGYLMNIYPMVVANAQINSITGFFSILGYMALFMVLMLSIINSCMSITYILPEAIWRFMGADTSQTVQVGRDTASNAQNAALGGAAIARSGDKTKFWSRLDVATSKSNKVKPNQQTASNP